jgi:hypothetical protein
MRGALVVAAAAVAACWHLGTQPVTSPSGLAAIAAVVLTGMIIAFLALAARIGVAVTARPLTGRAAALRRKSWSAAFQRQRDPDAAGHPRPRAPSAVPAAA